MDQKQLFFHGEGDAWLSRNRNKHYSPEADRFLQVLVSIVGNKILPEYSILEIGCGSGSRLMSLIDTFNCNCYGLDPSEMAIQEANSKHPKLTGIQGTADQLPFPDNKFDIVCFGSCLMWVDLCDLFKVASEAFRVAKASSILAYRDFYSSSYKRFAYHHDERIMTSKMNFTTMFTWHPCIDLVYHEVVDHRLSVPTANPDEFTSHAVLRVTKDFEALARHE